MTDIRCPHCGLIAAVIKVVPAEHVRPDTNIIDTLVKDYDWDPAYRTRIVNSLINGDVATFRDLCRLSRYNLLCWPNFGRKSCNIVEGVLTRHGLRLSTSTEVKNRKKFLAT